MSTENEFIASEIQRSGFPLECEIVDILESHGWEVRQSTFYLDLDDGEYKETDIIAHKAIASALKGTSSYPYNVSVALLIECKKREDIAHVFFQKARDPHDLDYLGVGLAAVDSFQVARISSIEADDPSIRRPRPRFGAPFDLGPKRFVPSDVARKIWGAHEQKGFIEARDFSCLAHQEKSLSYDVVKLRKESKKFDRDNERKLMHIGLTGLAKSVEDSLGMDAYLLQELLDAALDEEFVQLNPNLHKFFLNYTIPVMVLDGKLKVWRKGEIADANEVLHEVALHSKNYFRSRLVTIVIKGYFDEWLTQVETDANAIVRKIMSRRKLLDDQVELLQQNYIRKPTS